jgi:hypothetical protein
MDRTDAFCAILFALLIGFTIGGGLVASLYDWRKGR